LRGKLLLLDKSGSGSGVGGGLGGWLDIFVVLDLEGAGMVQVADKL
jgi:hypothetical protein